MSAYQEFLIGKRLLDAPSGMENGVAFNSKLFSFQQKVVRWALRRGRAAIFADCGLGKSFMQLEWARHLPGEVLILTPLAVAQQTVEEGRRFGIPCAYATTAQQITERITITNYERLENFEASRFCGVVLDESSILKAFDGKTRTTLIETFTKTPFRLCCTATPSPNDYMELGNHSEFLGVMSRTEMLAMFFVHDGGETQVWRIKGHAREKFWEWVCSWAVMFRKPSDVGDSDIGFVLPPLQYHQHLVEVQEPSEGYLFALEAQGLGDRLAARRESVTERVAACAKFVNETRGAWLVWCHLNSESEQLTQAIPGAVEVKGSDPASVKAARLLDFATGKIRILVSKPSIAGFGMNFQRCHQMAFVGLSDSYEELYQATRRCWRFGQTQPVQVHLIGATTEGAVLANIRRKERETESMAQAMVEAMWTTQTLALSGKTQKATMPHRTEQRQGATWEMRLGDCVEELRTLKEHSIHYSIFSPPFSSLYVYSASERDLGNSATHEQFFEHFAFVISELYRVLMPGRLVSVHCMNLPTSKVKHGVIGLLDFRGEIIRAFTEHGWIYHSEVVIWKDPVTAMQRAKALGLLHKQLKKDSCMSRQGVPDYLVTFRKPGENQERVSHTNQSFPVGVWKRYASPVWMDINPSDTLQFRSVREHRDERHICPLQLQVIERAIDLWTNKYDLVLSPFAGIGSEGFVALEKERRFLGIELKRSYFEQATRNLAGKENEMASQTLFAGHTPQPR